MRVALTLEYDGRQFYGWQHQENLRTVQACVETALATVAEYPINVICAGRTDAGVHALQQVIHFDTNVNRPLQAWVLGCNRILPKDIAIRGAQIVPDTFHARFSARARQYRYIIHNHPVRPALQHGLETWFCPSLNIDLMQQGAEFLLGENDFSSFRAANCQSKTPMRNIIFINIQREWEKVIIDIKANAFLHHMVRNIVGVLLEVGVGRQSPLWVKEVLNARNRCHAAATAKPDGLYLAAVEYDIPLVQGF